MENMNLSRIYLETLTTADLVSLADEYGIDIPEGLSRRFIIGELLETIDEPQNSADDDDDLVVVETIPVEQSATLPKSYNETQITALLRNPAWIFTYWDLNEADEREVKQTKSFTSFVLRVLYFANMEDEKTLEVYDIPVGNDDKDRYVFLSQTEKIVRIDLVAEFKNVKPRVLARSKKIEIPKGCQEISSRSLMQEVDPVLVLSGFPELCKSHYINHRQSFS